MPSPNVRLVLLGVTLSRDMAAAGRTQHGKVCQMKPPSEHTAWHPRALCILLRSCVCRPHGTLSHFAAAKTGQTGGHLPLPRAMWLCIVAARNMDGSQGWHMFSTHAGMRQIAPLSLCQRHLVLKWRYLYSRLTFCASIDVTRYTLPCSRHGILGRSARTESSWAGSNNR